MKEVAKENLLQIKDLLRGLSQEQYINEADVLSGATIGQHTRHILEFYLLLVSGSFSGIISYDKRERNTLIETDPEFAIITIKRLVSEINTLDESLHVKLEADYSIGGASQNLIASSVGRELAYCIEHSIHHQAIIKAALITMGLKGFTNEYFGVAYSTIRYRNNSN